MAEPRDRSSMGTVLLIARLGITGQVVFAGWRAQQDDDSASKRSSSSRLGEGWWVDSAGDESAGGHDLAADDEPEIVVNPAGIADPAHDDDDPGGVVDSAHHQNSAVDGPAGGDETGVQVTPAGNTPAAGRGLAVHRGGRRMSGLLVLPLIISFITRGHRWIVGQVRIPASWQTWECGQREVWVVIRVQTWGPVVPGRTTTNWEENHHSDPFASQTSGDGRLCRCDGSSRLGSFGWLSRCDGPDGLSRGTGLSRLWVSKGSRLHSGGGARDCVRLSSFCRPSTVSGPSRFRLSTPTGLSRWRLSTPTGLSRWWGSAGHGTPAGTTPVARQDTSMVSDVSTLIFPSLLRSINQATLVDFMSMWTLMTCNEGWTRVWQLQTPSPGPLIRHRRPDMIRLHLEDPGLQLGIPGLQTDDPGLKSDVPEGWTSPEIPLVHGLPLEDRPPQNLAPGMLHQSIFSSSEHRGESQGQVYLWRWRWWGISEECLSSTISAVSPGCDII